ncbi:hypothetical protein Q9L58_001427 [Maublancomyces gigas]|uniref:RING-type domain-containing protein n=1 Tax=Discina gigas TaxID=1032678 RepID=A0ABR3GV48_9PEZI
MSAHQHRPQHPLPTRSTRPSPSMPPTMQTRSSVARSTLSPDIIRTIRSTHTLERTVSPDFSRPLHSRQHSARPRPNRARGTNSNSTRIAAQSLIDLTESSPIRHQSFDSSPPPSGQGDYESHHQAKRRRVFVSSGMIEEVDLTYLADNEEENARRQAREELLKTQQAARKDEKRKVAGFTCVICMEDEPTDLAVTPCGHMFCHLCLHGAIKASASPSNKLHGRCPVCRGKVSLRDVVPMEFKILSKAQGKQKAV